MAYLLGSTTRQTASVKSSAEEEEEERFLNAFNNLRRGDQTILFTSQMRLIELLHWF